MNIGEAVKECILKLCNERDISVNKLSRMSGVTPSTVNNINHQIQPQRQRFHDQEALQWSGITIEDFFNSELFRNLEQELKLTGYSELKEKAAALNCMYEAVKTVRETQHVILLDAWPSATIEGARTTVAQVVASASDPKTKDDKMVLNAIRASNYAFKVPITKKNIRHLWETVVVDVCENEEHRGKLLPGWHGLYWKS